MRKTILISFITLVIIGALLLINKFSLERMTDIPDQNFNTEGLPSAGRVDFEAAPAITTFVSERAVIWGMSFLPDGRMLFTERAGSVNMVERDGVVREILSVPVYTRGESGLLGIAIDPTFSENNFVYLYYTYQTNGQQTRNRVSRYTFENDTLINETILVDNIPGAPTHDGGRIAFGPDGFLYITTGDAQAPALSQDRSSLAGKILRVTRGGEGAPGNPFDTRIYSYGHRNPQGITWDNEERLWATEHGSSTMDELNLIEAGVNYGWPEIRGNQTNEGMRTPVINSGGSTWAPGGAAFLDGSVFFAGLRGSALYQYNTTTGVLTTHMKDKLGRIRDVVVGPDGFLYVATSNRDGRGVPRGGDDTIVRVNPRKLGEL